MSGLRETLETRQVSIYFGAVAAAGALATLCPGASALAGAIEPLLAFMLFVTFLQVPLAELRQAGRQLRFLGALLVANFVAVPLLVALLLPGLPGDPLVRIAVLLVLLCPCIDYVVTFAHLGRGDARSLLASTPVLLALQMLLLPLYLGLFLGEAGQGRVQWAPFLQAFGWLIVLPLGLAALCQAAAARGGAAQRGVEVLGLMPVPATAAVLFVVVGGVSGRLGPALGAVAQALPVYLAFAAVAPVIGWGLARLWRLPEAQGRALAFSTATRNSLVVLPLGLAVPGALPVVPAVIVAQTLVELLAELVYVQVFRRADARRQ